VTLQPHLRTKIITTFTVAMVLAPATREACSVSQPSRVVYTMRPISLVYTGPNLDKAIEDLIAELIAAFKDHGTTARHFATSYTLSNITLLIDCFEPGEPFETSLMRLRYGSGNIWGKKFQDKGLSERITRQLGMIQRLHPDLTIPFRCIESWDGCGPQEYPGHDKRILYDKMVEASHSIEKWQMFLDGVRYLLHIIRCKIH
jgi:hypothetical protein